MDTEKSYATDADSFFMASQAEQLQVTINSLKNYAPDDPDDTPHPGYAFVLIDFTIKNLGYTDGYYFYPGYAKLRDKDGYRYDYHHSSFNIPGYFDYGTIPLGDFTRGKLVFEVPQESVGTSFKLIIKSS